MIDKSDHMSAELHAAPLANNKPVKVRGAGFALFIASLALLFAAAGIAAGYKHWQRMHDRAKDNARKIDVIEATLVAKTDSQVLLSLQSDIEQRIAAHQATATDQLRQMQQLQMQTAQFADTVSSQIEQVSLLQMGLQQATSPKTVADWQIAEVAFLLRLAGRELQLAGDHTAAVAALTAADKRLSELGAASYLPVRQQIGRELAVLATINPIDITALSQQLNAVLKTFAFESTSLATNSVGVVADVPANAKSSLWTDYKQKAIDTLNKAVVVRDIDPVTAALTTENRQHLQGLVQLRVENLRLMALQQNDAAYHEQIALLRNTVQQYCSGKQATALYALLDQLDSVNLEPERPDISGSLRQLRQTRVANLAGGH